MAPLVYKETTQARRAVIIKVLRMKGGERGLTTDEVIELCEQLHQAGKWPQAEWKHARNDPYRTGVYQHLQALKAQGRIREVRFEDEWAHRWSAPTVEELMPEDQARFKQAIIEARKHGIREAVLGVTPDFKRVIRVRVGRGEVERVLEEHESWEDGCAEVGIVV